MPFSTVKGKKIKHNTLQVRISPRIKQCVKKAYLSFSGSLTIETSLVLTLFLFAGYCLMLPMRIMDTDRKIQATLESVGEEFSLYAYGGNPETSSSNLLLGTAYAYAKVLDVVDTKQVTSLNLLRSSILQDGETILLIADYEIQLPFPILGLRNIERTAMVQRRAWIGVEGKEFSSEGDEDSDSDIIVYVGKTSTRYHMSQTCHYIYNDWTTTTLDTIETQRNQDGGRYEACKVCGEIGSSNTIYIMPNGTSYHTTLNCSAINAYVQAVSLESVKHLGACSYCSSE